MIPGSTTTSNRSDPGRGWTVASDSMLALVILGLLCVEIWVLGAHGMGTGERVVATVLSPAIALPVAVRTIHAFPAYLVNALTTIAMVAIGYEGDFYQWANLLMLFTLASAFADWRSWIGLGLGLFGVAFYFASFRDAETDTAIMVSALWLVVWLIGRVYGSRAEQSRLRVDRDLAAELAATRQERLELEAQRTTMARELHDLIGHTVNVMVVHAGAGRRAVRDDPDGAERAFTTIETTGRSALEELDRVLGLLRSDARDTPLAPLPDLRALPELVREFEGAGLAVSTTSLGPVDAVPHGLGLTAYRIVQETLTNTMKHSDAVEADVSIRVDDAQIRIVVTDSGPRRSGPADGLTNGGRPGVSGSAGRGLVGIAERVQLHGGQAEFGPIDGGGFRVDCTMPLARNEVSS